jgi:hypothetical protein
MRAHVQIGKKVHSENARYLAIHKLTSSTYKNTKEYKCVISGFRREVHENCALLGYYAAHSGNTLPTFRDNLSVPSSSFKKSKKKRPETSVRTCHYTLRNIAEQHRYHG